MYFTIILYYTVLYCTILYTTIYTVYFIDYKYYYKPLSLQEDLLDNLGHYIDLLADESHYFVIDPSGTKLMDKQFEEKVLLLIMIDSS